MGRAGFQHRWDDGSDRDGFQPGGSGEAEEYNTTCPYADRYPNAYRYAHSKTRADCHTGTAHFDSSTSHTHAYLVFTIPEDAQADRHTCLASESAKQSHR